MNSVKVDKRLLWPVLMGFFIMGFCDMVAPVTDVIAGELGPDTRNAVGFLPTMVFLWFFVLSVPFASLMNRIGRKATAMIGYGLTIAGLTTAYLMHDLTGYFMGFGLLGIGNTAIQVALNPLLATIVPGDRMTGYLTVGQIFRNTALLLIAPLVTALTAWLGDWRLLMSLYAGLTLIGAIWLQWTTAPRTMEKNSTDPADIFRLLSNRTVLICTLGVACFIAADVGVGFVSVRLLGDGSILTTTGYYALRILGTILGAWVLTRVVDVKYLRWNMLLALVLTGVLLFSAPGIATYALVGALGFAMACVFATFYAVATKSAPGKSNEVAGLMILAISAGALPGPVCNALIGAFDDPRAGLIFVAVCIGYLLWASFKLKVEA